MANINEEALFSLEIVINKLTIPNVNCKFPAVAFRLLDFPTLVIYHVEPELADNIKTKITSDPHYKLLPQIPELLDRKGSYNIRKGKSCLLKITPYMLHSHLQNTPLYVMVVDTFPKVPKLVGNCIVPLDATMNCLYDEICKHGLAVPIVHGEKGVYKIFNLMGTQIGGIEIGIRLLSLGVGLIPHLPAASVHSRGENVSLPSKFETNEIQEKVADMVLHNVPDKHKQILNDQKSENSVSEMEINLPKTDHFQVQTQTIDFTMQNIATQTEKFKKVKKANDAFHGINFNVQNVDKIDDIVPTNVVCPPPLYFNSENETGADYIRNILQVEDTISEDTFSDSDTIRKEDWLSASDDEGPLNIPEKSKNKKSQKERTKKLNQNIQQTVPKLKGFPLLNALMTEISSLQQQGQSEKNIEICRPQSIHKSRTDTEVKSKVTESKSQISGRTPSPDRFKDSFAKHLNRMSTPRHSEKEATSPKTPRKVASFPDKPITHHKCQEKPKPVPHQLSWIRQVPNPLGVVKTKLKSGMTNTQKLRLEKSNPDLLKKLEKEEEMRLRSWREQERKRKEDFEASGSLMSVAQYNIDGHRIDRSGGEILSLHQHRKPIPTPRPNSVQGMDHSDDDHDFDNKHYNSNQYHGMKLSARDDNQNNYHSESYYEYEESSDEAADAFKDSSPFSKFDNEKDTQKFRVETESERLPQNNDIVYSNKEKNPRLDTRSKEIANMEVEVVAESYNENNVPSAGIDAGEGLGLRKIVDEYSDVESEAKQSDLSFKSAASHRSAEHSQDNGNINTSKQVAYNVETPKASKYDPSATYLKNKNSHLRQSNGNVEASVDSTAYISRSQVLSQQSYESVENPNSDHSLKKFSNGRRNTARSRFNTINTESVSSYNGEEYENGSPRSGQTQDYQSESFEDLSDLDFIPEPKSMDQAKVAPEARLGYTWGY